MNQKLKKKSFFRITLLFISRVRKASDLPEQSINQLLAIKKAKMVRSAEVKTLVNKLHFSGRTQTSLVTKLQQKFTTTQQPSLATNDSTAQTVKTNSTVVGKKRRKGTRIDAKKRRKLVKEFRSILRGSRYVPENVMEKIKNLFNPNTKKAKLSLKNCKCANYVYSKRNRKSGSRFRRIRRPWVQNYVTVNNIYKSFGGRSKRVLFAWS